MSRYFFDFVSFQQFTQQFCQDNRRVDSGSGRAVAEAVEAADFLGMPEAVEVAKAVEAAAEVVASR